MLSNLVWALLIVAIGVGSLERVFAQEPFYKEEAWTLQKK